MMKIPFKIIIVTNRPAKRIRASRASTFFNGGGRGGREVDGGKNLSLNRPITTISEILVYAITGSI